MKSLTKDEVVKQEQQATVNLEVIIALIGGVLGWVLWTGFFLPFTSLKGTLTGNLLIPVGASIVTSTVIWFVSLEWIRRRKFSTISGIHLRYGHCAGCGYALQDLQTEHDGCIVCPECNAAWKSDRVGSAHG